LRPRDDEERWRRFWDVVIVRPDDRVVHDDEAGAAAIG
jgi:hypothetical protein